MTFRRPLTATCSPVVRIRGGGGNIRSRSSPISNTLRVKVASPHHRRHKRLVKKRALKGAAAHSDPRIERTDCNSCLEWEGGRGEEWVVEGPGMAKWEGVVEGTCVTKK